MTAPLRWSPNAGRRWERALTEGRAVAVGKEPKHADNDGKLGNPDGEKKIGDERLSGLDRVEGAKG